MNENNWKNGMFFYSVCSAKKSTCCTDLKYNLKFFSFDYKKLIFYLLTFKALRLKSRDDLKTD